MLVHNVDSAIETDSEDELAELKAEIEQEIYSNR